MILISFKIHVINPIVIKNRIDTIIIKREAVMPNLWDIQVFFNIFFSSGFINKEACGSIRTMGCA